MISRTPILAHATAGTLGDRYTPLHFLHTHTFTYLHTTSPSRLLSISITHTDTVLRPQKDTLN